MTYNIKEVQTANTSEEANALMKKGWRLFHIANVDDGKFAYFLGLPSPRKFRETNRGLPPST